MKAGIKRIEATLHDLGTTRTTPVNEGILQGKAEANNSPKRSFSFRISVAQHEPKATPSVTEPDTEPEQNFHQNISVQTFAVKDDDCKSPSLPKFKTPNFTSHGHAANPALATNLLQEIQANVGVWQVELQKIIRQIQDIYLEGPIVNGWLESYSKTTESVGRATLRHAEVDQLMDYVEEICSEQGKVSNETSRTGYRLCALDASGKVCSRPCPPDQVPSVSMAIARYQKLRQLLGRKEYLETRLTQLAETLAVLHGHIQSQ